MDGKRGFAAGGPRPKKLCFVDGDVPEDSDDEQRRVRDDDLDLDTAAAGRGNRRVRAGGYSASDSEPGSDDGDALEAGPTGGDGGPPAAEDPVAACEEDDFGSEDERAVGAPLTAFNMAAEEEEGMFTGAFQDSYQARRDETAYMDGWLDGVSRADMARALAAEEARRQRAAQAERAAPQRSASDMLQQLRAVLRDGETPTQGLQRLHSLLPPRRVGQRSRPPVPPADVEGHRAARDQIERITELCTGLLPHNPAIYETRP